MKITAVTCTCDRPEAFALCERYISRQTVKPDQWIVMDDSRQPIKHTMGQDYHYVPQFRGTLSMPRKLGTALGGDLIKGDAVIVIEDDDFYRPEWIQFCIEGLKSAELFGEGRALYYNVRDRWWQRHRNMKHSSLCSTAFTRKVMPYLRGLCQNATGGFVDMKLWLESPFTKKVVDPMTKEFGFTHRVVGIKAMPGTVGYSDQHKRRVRESIDDVDGSFLRGEIGEDAELYAGFFNPSAANQNQHMNARQWYLKHVAEHGTNRIIQK
jgi:hypothetical protein